SCKAYTHDSQLQLEANDLGHCAVYEKELQRIWPITEENRKAKIAEFAEKQGFRLAYYKQGHCAIFLEDFSRHDSGTSTPPAKQQMLRFNRDVTNDPKKCEGEKLRARYGSEI